MLVAGAGAVGLLVLLVLGAVIVRGRRGPGEEVVEPVGTFLGEEPFPHEVAGLDPTWDDPWPVRQRDAEPILIEEGPGFGGGPRRRLDERRWAAVRQQQWFREAKTESWRSARAASVMRTDDGREALILDRPVRRRSAERALRTLIEARAHVTRAMPRGVGIDLHWPDEMVVVFDGGVDGYFSAALEEQYATRLGRREKAVRTLQFAVGARGLPQATTSPEERLELVRLLGQWAAALHQADVVHGNLGLGSVAYDPDTLRITPLDYTAARVLGHGPWTAADPAAGEQVRESSLDGDRLEFARAAFGLLLPEVRGGMDNFMSIPGTVSGLDRDAIRRMRDLWALAATGVRGTMPTLQEWVEVIGAPEVSAEISAEVGSEVEEPDAYVPDQRLPGTDDVWDPDRRSSVERDRLDVLPDQAEDDVAVVGSGDDGEPDHAG